MDIRTIYRFLLRYNFAVYETGSACVYVYHFIASVIRAIARLHSSNRSECSDEAQLVFLLLLSICNCDSIHLYMFIQAVSCNSILVVIETALIFKVE